MKKLNENYKSCYCFDLIKKVEDDMFETGQCYDGIPDKMIICRKCGSNQFIVGMGSYHTSIKCPNCLYELCIHDG